jgi:predicted ABC-type ATPase
MPVKRLRIFAGPNGSGKTTIINAIQNKIRLGIYVNADDMEALLKTKQHIDLRNYKIELSTSQVRHFLKHKGFAISKFGNADFINALKVDDNKIVIKKSAFINSYLVADLAELIRNTLLLQSSSFSYETVMSHPAKLAFIKKAKEAGYRIYVYYVATEDPQINISRVKIRVAQKGHPVSVEKIRSRYKKSLEHLKSVVKLSDRAYIFDNSRALNLLIAEITNGLDVNVFDTNKVPNWFVKYLMNN